MARSNSAKAPTHLYHHAACRSGRVDRLGQAAESRSGFPELFHDREHIAQGARELVQLPDHDHIPGAELLEQPEELWTFPAPPGSLLAEDEFATRRFERRHLSRRVLIVGGNAGVADQHCIKVLHNRLVSQ